MITPQLLKRIAEAAKDYDITKPNQKITRLDLVVIILIIATFAFIALITYICIK